MKYNQSILIAKINAYLRLKKRPLILDQGYCHGLTLLWLYKMAEKKEKWYYDLVKRIVDTPNDKLEDIEIDIEKFIAHIEWLQKPEKYIPSIRQMDIDKTAEVPKEIPVSSVLESSQLDALLDLVIQPEKMVCISGPDHSIGVYRYGSNYHIYNPNYDTGVAKIVVSIGALRQELIKCLFTDFKYSGVKLPVTINVLGDEEITEENLEEKQNNIYKWIIQSTGVMNFCDYGIGPLYLACENHNDQLTEMLLEKGAAPNMPTKNGKYPLVLASYSGYAKLVALLLKYDANPNIEAREGLPLYLACKHGHEDVIKLLLTGGALVNKPDKDGETAIFASVNAGHRKFTKLLLEHKSDPLRPRRDGDTAMDIAIRMKDWVTVVMMLMYVETPHARNFGILKRNKMRLIEAANTLKEQKEMAPTENKKVVGLIEEISTKKRNILKTVKNPEHSKRDDGFSQPECKAVNEDMNRFFAHFSSVQREEQSVACGNDTNRFVAT